MMEILLNIIPQRFIRTKNRGIIEHIQIFAISKVAIAVANYCNFSAIVIPQKANQPMKYLSEKIRKV